MVLNMVYCSCKEQRFQTKSLFAGFLKRLDRQLRSWEAEVEGGSDGAMITRQFGRNQLILLLVLVLCFVAFPFR